MDFDIIVIGAGPGGYVAAIRAAQLGLKTALVEANHLGGVCLNWGCIPTKAMLRSAELYRHFRHAENFGLSSPHAGFDLQKIVGRSRNIANQLSAGVGHLLKKNKVTIFNGYGRLLGRGRLSIEKKVGDPKVLAAKHILVASGSRPRIIPGLESDGNLVWTSREALAPKSLPQSLLVIGSGAIGLEFASFYNAFGTQVTVVEIMDQILPAEDREIAEIAQKEMEKQGVRFLLGTRVGRLHRAVDTVEVTCEKDGKTEGITVSRVISAVGVVPNVEDIGLAVAGVLLDDRGFIKTDVAGRTTAAGIYAIGDVAGGPCLAHKASHEAMLCVETIAGSQEAHGLDKTLIPSCIYSHPQVASVGLTEAKAKEAGYQIKVGRFPARGNGKALAMGETEGMVKTIFDARTGELLGAHLVGSEVTELIQILTIAKNLETTEVDLMRTIFAHPTLSEMIHESVLGAYGQAIHI